MTEKKVNKETAGAASRRLFKGAFDNTHSPHEQMSEQLTDYEKNIDEAIKSGIKRFDGDFYIVVLTKREPLMQNILRFYYFPRKTCPTPQNNQVVYAYKRESSSLSMVWVVPSLEACVTLVNEASIAHKDEMDLLKFVLDYRDGTLLRKAMMLNGEIDK